MGDENTIQELKVNNSTVIYPLDILNEIKVYYTNLHAKDRNVDDRIESLDNYL